MADGNWIVALSGASGMPYALRLIDAASASVNELHVVISEAAFRVLREEQGLRLSTANLTVEALIGRPQPNVIFHHVRDVGASIASGSMLVDGMVIVPCSMNTLAAVSSGVANNLITRAADVTLKEGRRLVIVPRETPMSVIHLQNLVKLSEAGARIVPAMPGFYHNPESLDDLVDMMVMKILDQMGIANELVPRWDGAKVKASVQNLERKSSRKGEVTGLEAHG